MRVFVDAVEDEEVRFSGRRRPDALARGRGQVEAARLADARVIGDELLPIDLGATAERGARKARDDGWLAPQMLGGWPVAARRRMHHRHRIFDRNRLRPFGLN